MKKQVRRVGAEKFVVTWQASGSVREVANKLKIPVRSVRSRARYYRSLGVRLKSMVCTHKRLDITALNRIIDKGR